MNLPGHTNKLICSTKFLDHKMTLLEYHYEISKKCILKEALELIKIK